MQHDGVRLVRYAGARSGARMDIVGKRGAQQQADIRVVRMPRVDCFVCARENPGCNADAQARVRRACGDAPTREASIEAARRAGSNPRPPALPTRSPLGPRDARTRPRSEDVATRHGLTLERKAKKRKTSIQKKAGSKTKHRLAGREQLLPVSQRFPEEAHTHYRQTESHAARGR